MPDQHPPALTPAEWQRREVDRPPRAITDRNGVLKVHGIGTSVIIPDEFRHPLAALCLDGQPFGFVPEELARLRVLIKELEYEGDAWAGDVTFLRSLADRIAALLPASP